MHNAAQLKSEFLLDPSITYLAFGSFGACARPIFEDYQKWQLEIEREPARFFSANGAVYLQKSREALAKYVNCSADDLVFTPNPSYAINMVARSLNLKPADQVLSTNLEYGALDKAWRFHCKKQGAEFVSQPISLPLTSKEVFIEEFFRGLTPKTRAIFLCEMTSTTALRFPVKEICEIAKQKGLITIIDGAHVPGHLPLDLSSIQADIYTGACHKWMMTPKGCSFLFVRKELQPLEPLVVSWGYDNDKPSASLFLDYHQMQGTRDYSAFLTVPKAIAFMQEHNWTSIAAACRKLAHSNYERFCTLLGSAPLCPVNDDFLGQMCSIPLSTNHGESLQTLLFEKYRIDIPVMRHGNRTFLRYSIQAYNTQQDLDKLFEALQEILVTTDLIMKTVS